MNTWIDETKLPDKEAIKQPKYGRYYRFNYRHAKTVFENFINKNSGYYHDLYVQSDTLLFLQTYVLKYRNLNLLIFYLHQD